MANLSSADPVYDEAGPSYDSDVLSEVQDRDHYQDTVCDYHDEREMHDDVQPNHVVDSHADYTSDSHMTPYDQSRPSRKKTKTKSKPKPEKVNRKSTQVNPEAKKVLRMSDLPGILKKIDDALHVVVPKIFIDATNYHLKDNLPKIISQDLATRVPKMIEELFKQHMKSTTSNVCSSSKASIASIFDLQRRLKMRLNVQSQIDDSVIWGGLQDKFGMSSVSPSTCRPHASRHRDQDDHLDDNPKGEKNSKNQKSTFESSSANVTTSSNPTSSKSKVEANTEFIAEIQGTKWVPTTVDFDKMKFAHNNILKSRFKTGAEPAQVFKGCARDLNAPSRYLFNKDLFFLRNGNTDAKKYILSLHKIHATSFPEDDLEELLKR
ncbi:hypothetical protein Tco_0443391 [Tanacetum coccineum]